MGVADTSRPNLVKVLCVPLDGHLRLLNVKKRPLETFEVSQAYQRQEWGRPVPPPQNFWQISYPYLNQGGTLSPPSITSPPPDFQTLRRPW